MNPKQKHLALVVSPEILNPKSKVNTSNSYPNTVESTMFCRVNRHFNVSGNLSACDLTSSTRIEGLYFFPRSFTGVAILSWVKTATSCGSDFVRDFTDAIVP